MTGIMRHGGAVSAFPLGAFRVDMNELVILDHVGIDIDAVLIDQMP
jgi:hypothetical protein